MYSDDLLEQRYTTSDPNELTDYFSYRIWPDMEGNEIGVTVSVDATNDLHYDIPIFSWNRYVEIVLRAGDHKNVTEKFRARLKKQKSIYAF